MKEVRQRVHNYSIFMEFLNCGKSSIVTESRSVAVWGWEDADLTTKGPAVLEILVVAVVV